MTRSESIARLLVITGLIIVAGVPLLFWWRTPIVHARMPEAGGWSTDALQATVGEPLHLRLTSDDVVHSFAVGGQDMPAVDVLPGKVTRVTLDFDVPGTYTFYCTRWCGPNHWRMRGIIEVTGGPGAAQAVSEPVTPLYAELGLDLDAPRRAEVLPAARPVSGLVDRQWMDALAPYDSLDYYRSHAPAEAWLELRSDASFSTLGDQELWDATASLWNSNTSAASLAEGRRLFAQNCAACHGSAGQGDGVFAGELAAASGNDMAPEAGMMQAPADLADPSRMLAASPALLHGKIMRGGMGTGMPSWGPILTEEQAWNLVAYLYSFQFEYR